MGRGFVWKSQLLGISACKLWAWGVWEQSRGVWAAGWVCLQDKEPGPRRSSASGFSRPEDAALIHLLIPSFTHPSIRPWSKGGVISKHLLDPNHVLRITRGGGYLSVPSSTFTVTLNGSKYYFLSQEAEENQVSEWEGNLLKGTSWEEPEQVLSPGISDPKSCSSRCTQK